MESGQFNYIFEPMSFFRTVGLILGLSTGFTLVPGWTGYLLVAQSLPQDGLKKSLVPVVKDVQTSDVEAFSLDVSPEISQEISQDVSPEISQENSPSTPPASPVISPADALDLEPAILENSPVLQRWIDEVPDVLSDIEQDPSFRPRLRAGYSQGWSDNDGGFMIGVEDIFLGTTGLTVSGDYRGEWDGDEQQYGVDLRYYLLPLGKNVNVAPVLGYRSVNVESGDPETDGANVGIRLLWVPARTGAADVSLTQTWVEPGSDRALSRFILSAGYAVTPDLRLSTDIQIHTSDHQSQADVGFILEWLL